MPDNVTPFQKLISEPEISESDRAELTANQAEVEQLINQWSSGTFVDVIDIILYHFSKHSKSMDVGLLKYLRKADTAFHQIIAKSGNWRKIEIEDLTDPTGLIHIIRYDKIGLKEFIVLSSDDPAKIVTYGINK